MAKLMKSRKHKIAPPQKVGDEKKKIVLVGTYAGTQLTDWPGYYPYPITTEDKVDAESCAKVNEIWLFKGTKEPKYFAAEFVGVKTREELKSLGYPAKGKGHGGGSYLLFKIEKTYAPASSSAALAAAVERVIVRTKDFARSPKVRKQLKAYLESTDRTDKELAAQLPSIITKLPAETLRVCEAAMQLDFLDVLDPKLKLMQLSGTAQDIDYPMIDLFAGAGGLSEGLEEAGFHSVFASEIVAQYADTYRRNHPGTEVVTEDIRNLDPEKIREALGIKKGELALIAGGPPCQGFSINAPVRSVLDKRNHLFKEYLRFVDAFQPRVILIENVPGLVSFEDGATLHAILKALGELGYGADVRILGAAYYGVPQMRWRTVILGMRGRELPPYAFPEPICHAPIRANFTATFDGHSLLKIPAVDIPGNFVSVKDAIGDLPPLKGGERGLVCKEYRMDPTCDFQRHVRIGSPGVYNHEAPRLSPINLERLRYIKPGGNWTDIPNDLLPKGMKLARRSDHTKRYGRLTPEGLASTILTKCDPHWGAYFHYEQDRSLTVREAARCQSFPDHYIFYGSQQEQYAQVGNAVPPMLAKAVGVALKAILDEEK